MIPLLPSASVWGNLQDMAGMWVYSHVGSSATLRRVRRNGILDRGILALADFPVLCGGDEVCGSLASKISYAEPNVTVE